MLFPEALARCFCLDGTYSVSAMPGCDGIQPQQPFPISSCLVALPQIHISICHLSFAFAKDLIVAIHRLVRSVVNADLAEIPVRCSPVEDPLISPSSSTFSIRAQTASYPTFAFDIGLSLLLLYYLWLSWSPLIWAI